MQHYQSVSDNLDEHKDHPCYVFARQILNALKDLKLDAPDTSIYFDSNRIDFKWRNGAIISISN